MSIERTARTTRLKKFAATEDSRRETYTLKCARLFPETPALAAATVTTLLARDALKEEIYSLRAGALTDRDIRALRRAFNQFEQAAQVGFVAEAESGLCSVAAEVWEQTRKTVENEPEGVITDA